MIDPRQERLVRLTTLIVLGDWDGLRAARAAAPAGEPDRAWREVVLQSHLFAGFPRVVEAYEVLTQAGGLGDPLPEEKEGPGEFTARGAPLFERIYGEAAQGVRARLASFHPDYGHWVAEHAYGRVLSRPGLDAATRELCAVAALLALGQERQLASHARGAVRCGASPAQVAAVAECIAEWVLPERLERGRAVLLRFAR